MASAGPRVGRLRADEDGSAVIEFIFVAIVILVPLLYLVVAVASIQRSRLAVTNAARDMGRAIAMSSTDAEASTRSQAALRIALEGEGITPSEVDVRYVAGGGGCGGAAVSPTVEPGSVFTVCVSRHMQIPAVPRFVAGRGVQTVGRYVVHVDEFAAVAS